MDLASTNMQKRVRETCIFYVKLLYLYEHASSEKTLQKYPCMLLYKCSFFIRFP